MRTIRGDGDDEDRYDDMTGMVDKRQKQFIESIAYIALPDLPNKGFSGHMLTGCAIHSEAKTHKNAVKERCRGISDQTSSITRIQRPNNAPFPRRVCSESHGSIPTTVRIPAAVLVP